MLLRAFDVRLRPSRLVARYVAVLFLVGCAFWTFNRGPPRPDATIAHSPVAYGVSNSPIKQLMIEANTQFEQLVSKQPADMWGASNRYRARRGRHPPPGFDKWVDAAMASNAVIVEDFFDRIYKDLAPFWALDPATVRARANAWHWTVRIRRGRTSVRGNQEGKEPWLDLWGTLVNEFAEHMPDIDMPINFENEPRLLVPFDQVNSLIEKERASRQMLHLGDVTTKYQKLYKVDEADHKPYDPQWVGSQQSYWNMAVKTCAPSSPAFEVAPVDDFSKAPELPHDWAPDYAFKGFVKNWTAAMDPCQQPHLREMHGAFVQPLSMSVTDELIPLFGGSKLSMNNDILLPGAMYLNGSAAETTADELIWPWRMKKNKLIWRGDASGGHPTAETWQHFQKHRLVQMLDGRTVSRLESGGSRAESFELPSPELYTSELRESGQLGAWLSKFSDCAFTKACTTEGCTPPSPFYNAPDVPLLEQYSHKFLPDVDGNSFSMRFRSFLRSTSLPLKATIFAEWHDDRLVPWMHFVPLDNTFRDLHAVLEYFSDGSGRGDAAARFIAERGSEWADKALRREDMKLYVWRLLLEWARVVDDNRDTLGFTDDVGEAPG